MAEALTQTTASHSVLGTQQGPAMASCHTRHPGLPPSPLQPRSAKTKSPGERQCALTVTRGSPHSTSPLGDRNTVAPCPGPEEPPANRMLGPTWGAPGARLSVRQLPRLSLSHPPRRGSSAEPEPEPEPKPPGQAQCRQRPSGFPQEQRRAHLRDGRDQGLRREDTLLWPQKRKGLLNTREGLPRNIRSSSLLFG